MTYNTIRTYAEIMRDYAERPNQRLPASRYPSKLLWDGSKSEILFGMVSHDLLRDHGEVGYRCVQLVINGYFFKALKNTLQVVSVLRDEEVFNSSFGPATRTMSITQSNIRPADSVRFNRIIRLSFEVRCMEASLLKGRSAKLPDFVTGIKNSTWDIPPEEVVRTKETPRDAAQMAVAESRKVYATRPLPLNFTQADSISPR